MSFCLYQIQHSVSTPKPNCNTVSNEIHMVTFGVLVKIPPWGIETSFEKSMVLEFVPYSKTPTGRILSDNGTNILSTTKSNFKTYHNWRNYSSKPHHDGREGGRERVTICFQETTVYFSFVIDRESVLVVTVGTMCDV